MFSKVSHFTSIGNVADLNKKTYNFCNIFESFQNNSNTSTGIRSYLNPSTCTLGIKAVLDIYFP